MNTVNQSVFSWRSRISCMVCGLTAWSGFGLASDALAQGTVNTIQILRTTDSQTLSTLSYGVGTHELSTDPVYLDLIFGFQTDEVSAPFTLFDSLTLSLRSDDGAVSIVLATLDTTGPVFLPPSPGNLLMDPSTLFADPISGAVIPQGATKSWSYGLRAILPTEFGGKSSQLYLDLFSNRNGVESLGWLTQLQVVPEPGLLGFAAVGLAALALQRANKKARDRDSHPQC